ALEQAVTALGGPAAGQDEQVDRLVYANPGRFATALAVTAEQVEDNVLTVTVSVDINLAGVRAVLPRSTARPARRAARRSVLILATEQLGPDQLIRWSDYIWTPQHAMKRTTAVIAHRDSGVVTATLASALREGGMRVIDPKVLRGKLTRERAYEVDELGSDVAATVARRADADLVIIARGSADLAYNRQLAASRMTSAQGSVVARLVDTRSGEVVATATEHAAQVHIDPDTARRQALAAASKACAKQLLEQTTNGERQ
ncbi:MAG: hypothetical protein AB7L28_18645, partial [Kofleriaceae bacterium]